MRAFREAPALGSDGVVSRTLLTAVAVAAAEPPVVASAVLLVRGGEGGCAGAVLAVSAVQCSVGES
jgi:hypothetical protein